MASKSVLLSLGALFFLCSCGTQRKNSFLYDSIAKREGIEKIIEDFHASPPSSSSLLLYYLNLGRIYHIHEKYYASNLFLMKAKELASELYTQSLSKKVQALILNDTYDIYYGEKYEHSLIRFYLSLNNVMLWQQGRINSYPLWVDGKIKTVAGRKLSEKERQQSLMTARAALLNWDSYLSELKDIAGVKSVFKEDLLAKTYGSTVHEVVGGRNDLQIALQLYKDARNLMNTDYRVYSSFTNKKAQLDNILKHKILYLTKNIRPADFKNQVKKLKMEKNIKEKHLKGDNITIIVQGGQIPRKVAEKHHYSLAKGISRPGVSGAIATVGATALSAFAVKELGLTPPPKNYRPLTHMAGTVSADIAALGVAIAFELPKMAPSSPHTYSLAVYQGDKKIFSKEVPLINPLGEIATQAIREKALALYSRLGLRLAIKYASLVATAYTVYKKNKNPLTRSAALMAFTLGTRAIAASEKADLRYWTALPQDIGMLSVSLPAGSYFLEVYKSGNTIPFYRKKLIVQEKQTKVVNVQELTPVI